jgi:hypothetical protein
MLFHSVVGNDEREGNSPSWFNVLECKQVCNSIVALPLATFVDNA